MIDWFRAGTSLLAASKLHTKKGCFKLARLGICLGMVLSIMPSVQAETLTGDAAAGKGKAAVCAACHGNDGKALLPEYPNLAGQGAKYIAKQLLDYKEGRRENAIMLGMASPLSEQDMADLAAYFASLPAVAGVAEDNETLTLGQSIYRGGITSAGIAACIGCHGPAGKGNPASAYPQLAGQNSGYVVASLQQFRSGIRNNDPNEMMRMLAHRLSDNEIAAVSNYIQGLH